MNNTYSGKIPNWHIKCSKESMNQKSIQLNSKFPEPYNNIGTIYLKRGDFIKARPLFEKAIDLKPDYVYALKNLSLLYSITGEITKKMKWNRS